MRIKVWDLSGILGSDFLIMITIYLRFITMLSSLPLLSARLLSWSDNPISWCNQYEKCCTIVFCMITRGYRAFFFSPQLETYCMWNISEIYRAKYQKNVEAYHNRSGSMKPGIVPNCVRSESYMITFEVEEEKYVCVADSCHVDCYMPLDLYWDDLMHCLFPGFHHLGKGTSLN